MVRALCRFDFINLVQTVAPGLRQIESEMALDLITIPAVSALDQTGLLWLMHLNITGKGQGFLVSSWGRIGEEN